jgi:hypothetical protein
MRNIFRPIAGPYLIKLMETYSTIWKYWVFYNNDLQRIYVAVNNNKRYLGRHVNFSVF